MRFWGIICLVVSLVACANVTKEDLGIAKQSPDEKVVEQRSPLSLPPEFDVRPVKRVVSQ